MRQIDVVLVKRLVGDPGERVARQDGQQLPAQVQRGLDAPVLIHALGYEAPLQLRAEFEAQLVGLRKLILTYDGGEAARARDLGVRGEELVREVRVVGPREALARAVLHESGEGRQDAHRRVDALLRQLAREDYLTLGDIAREVGDGVRDIVARHGEDGHQGDAARLSPDEPRALIDGGEV